MIEWYILYGGEMSRNGCQGHGMRMERWREIIVAGNTSGMKKKEWMRIHNVSPKMFYRKQKELRDYEMKKAGITAADITHRPKYH